MFFMSEPPIPSIKYYIQGKEALINIDNSTTSFKSLTKNCNSKN